MALQVVGAGVGRTGTHSLKLALERLLGGRCHHMTEVFGQPEQIAQWTTAIAGGPVDWEALMAPYTAQVDWPGASFWPELAAAHPDAVVVLSWRDPDDWYTSATNTIFGHLATGDDPWMAAMRQLLADRFSDRLDDRDAMVAAYRRHYDSVRAAVPADRLLEWQATDGWGPLCEALGVAEPDEPFPLTNTTADFRAMLGREPG